ncbi:MAG: enoyl-CoA hydratase/isomerase family protein [Pyrobaculum sp.]|uniref:enoyl-CoA hydratase/isomerase family protein n=1 Tax=Pyrobaculum sp. TaxID=2004705 RepID=UPI00315EE0FF
MRAYASGKIVVEELEEGVYQLLLNYPEKLNVITLEMRRGIGEAVRDLRNLPAKVVVVASAGDKAFSAGGDMGEFLKTTTADLLEWGRTLVELEELPVPTVAELKGYVLGGGLEFALSCDIRIASEDSVLGLPEVRLGMVPASGGLTRFVKAVGPLRSKYYLLLGKRMSAREAYALGLVDEVVPRESLRSRVLEVARELKELPPFALKEAKKLIALVADAPREVGFDLERKTFGVLRYSRDFEEGIKSFFEKRKPSYKGA